MNQKGLIPIIYLIIGAVAIASAVFGVAKYKDEITANVSKILKSRTVVYNIVSTAETPQPQNQSGVIPNNSEQAPNLFVQSSAYYPSAPIKEDIMTFFATIKNQGEGPANSSIVSLGVDGVIIGRASTMTLLSNKAETITWGKIWKATFGIHAFEICADADSEITESDETNNCYSSNFSVLKTAPLPDYIIESSTIIPGNPVLGDTLSFTAIVYNQGNAEGTSSFTSLKIDEDNDGTWNITARNAFTDTLNQGDSGKERWDFAWAPTKSGTHKYKICADATFLIAESDENNNCLSKTFTVPQ